MSAGGERGWYLRRGRYQVGPFPVDEIAHLLQDGRIAEGDFARRSGSREWFPATRLHDEIGQSAQGAALPEPPAAVEAAALAGARNEAVNRLEVPQQRTGPASAGVVVRRVAGFAAAGTRWLRSRFSIESVAVLLSGILVVFLLTRLDYQELLGLPEAVVVSNEAVFGEPVRMGDTLGTCQIVRSVGELKQTKVGQGRFWTIDVRTTNQRGEWVGSETYSFLGYRRPAA
mgnify:CR=1 FL=1